MGSLWRCTMPPTNAIACGSAGRGKSRAAKRRSRHASRKPAASRLPRSVLAHADYHGYYRGFANGMLWPLLHGRVGLSEFRRIEFAVYLVVNTAFAKALVPLLRPDDTIWIHDYHLFPLGQALRDTGVRCPIGFFLHVPFPPPSLFECLPQGDKLLSTLTAYHAVGVQVPDDAANLNALLDKLGIVTAWQAAR